MPGSSASDRLFLALTPPLPVRDAMAALRTPSRNIRWTSTNQLHITLRFLGETPVEATNVLLQRLSEVHVAPFVLPIEGVGAFPQKGPPRVLWAGVGSGHPRLHQLRQRIDDLLLAIPGIDADLRTFHPHVTVGRCNENAGPAVAAWLRTHREFAGPVFLVEAFDLYASEHRPGGTEYRLLQSFPLAM
jgi:2'-5' RNA ligase